MALPLYLSSWNHSHPPQSYEYLLMILIRTANVCMIALTWASLVRCLHHPHFYSCDCWRRRCCFVAVSNCDASRQINSNNLSKQCNCYSGPTYHWASPVIWLRLLFRNEIRCEISAFSHTAFLRIRLPFLYAWTWYCSTLQRALEVQS